MGYTCTKYGAFVNAPQHTSKNDKCPLCLQSHYGDKTKPPATKATVEAESGDADTEKSSFMDKLTGKAKKKPAAKK